MGAPGSALGQCLASAWTPLKGPGSPFFLGRSWQFLERALGSPCEISGGPEAYGSPWTPLGGLGRHVEGTWKPKEGLGRSGHALGKPWRNTRRRSWNALGYPWKVSMSSHVCVCVCRRWSGNVARHNISQSTWRPTDSVPRSARPSLAGPPAMPSRNTDILSAARALLVSKISVLIWAHGRERVCRQAPHGAAGRGAWEPKRECTPPMFGKPWGATMFFNMPILRGGPAKLRRRRSKAAASGHGPGAPTAR